jgi:adenine-specific DNA-methyltransferase
MDKRKSELPGKMQTDSENHADHASLLWAGKNRSAAQAEAPPCCALYPCEEDSADWENTRNLYIEGDNLEALKLLKSSFADAVKLIYIDPPYNTGGGFIYNDTYGDAHSGWLCMMYPRLILARELLRPDGAICISINENELFHLKLVCDEVFGESNYLTTFTVKVRHEGRILKGDKDYHEVTEYLLMYRRSAAFRAPKRETEARLSEYVWRVEELSAPADTYWMDGKAVRAFRPGQYRLIRQEAGPQGLKRVNIRGALKEGNSSGRFYMKHLDAFSAQRGLLFKVPDMGGDGLGFRYFLTPETDRRRNGDYFQGVPKKLSARTIPYSNLMDFERAFNRVGLEGGVEFRNGKKPVAFMEKVLEIAGMYQSDGIVLDFFAGSATTAHAVMRCNLHQRRRSRFIMIQLDEDLDSYARTGAGETRSAARRAVEFLDTIGRPHRLSELGKERLRRAGAQLRAEAEAAGLPVPDVGFRVFRLQEAIADEGNALKHNEEGT